MTMTILITSCVWVGFFTILNHFEQKNYLKLQAVLIDLLSVSDAALDTIEDALSDDPQPDWRESLDDAADSIGATLLDAYMIGFKARGIK
tara:strand:- start:2348 stop:2617 length:270 start_codon:yes stop_codon:yes gene_type:complete